MSLGNNIKKYRRDLGMTQEELAGILCITSQAVSSVENGNVTGDRIIDTNFSEQYNCWDNLEYNRQ